MQSTYNTKSFTLLFNVKAPTKTVNVKFVVSFECLRNTRPARTSMRPVRLLIQVNLQKNHKKSLNGKLNQNSSRNDLLLDQNEQNNLLKRVDFEKKCRHVCF